MASASKYPAIQAVKSLHKTGEWAKYFEEGDAAMIENDYIQTSLFDRSPSADCSPSADSSKVEEELAKGKRSVRKQIEKARAFVDKFSSDLEIRRTAADASPELIALWEELKHAYQAENNAGERIQDCLDKHAASFLSSAVLTLRRYPKTSEMIRQTKESMNAKINFPALFERLLVVTKLDNERKGLQKFAENAKATRLESEKRIKSKGATLDPSYIPAPSYTPATPGRAPECY